MKRGLLVFTVILAAALVLLLFLRALLPHIALTQLKSAFPGYVVSIGGAGFRDAGTIAVTDIDIMKDKTLHYRIGSVEINFSPLSLITRIIPRVAVRGASLEVISPDKKLKELIEYPVPKPGKGFIVQSVKLYDLMLRLDTADWRLQTLADGDISLGKDMTYNAKFKLNNMDLAFLIKAFDAGDKIDLSGSLTGDLTLNGKNMRITAIKGNFLVVPPGGRLVIMDEEFLKKLAENTKQPFEVIEAGFKDYDFTKGALEVSRNSESILLHIVLDGVKGERDLTVALHGF